MANIIYLTAGKKIPRIGRVLEVLNSLGSVQRGVLVVARIAVKVRGLSLVRYTMPPCCILRQF